MKPFNLEEYLQNPSRKVVTRSGKNVTIHCTNYQGSFPIVAEIEGLDTSMAFAIDGVYGHIQGSNYDLFFAPEKHEGWVNIFKEKEFRYTAHACVCKSREDAEKQAKGFSDYEATIKVEWEE